MLTIIGLLVWSFVALIIALIINEVLFWALSQLGVMQQLTSNMLTIIESTAYYVILLAVLVGVPWIVLKRKSNLELLGVQRSLRWVDIGLALSGTVLYFVVVYAVMTAVSALFPQIDQNQVQETGITMPYGYERVLVFLLFVVAAPIAEELIFRGYLQGVLRKNGVSAILAIIIVNVLFGAAHGQWNVGISVGILGVLMSIGREITGAIWPGVLMHMIKNGIAFYALYVIGMSIGG